MKLDLKNIDFFARYVFDCREGGGGGGGFQ